MSFHKSLGMKPFKVLYGHDPLTLIPYEANNVDYHFLHQVLTERDDTIITLNENLVRSTNYENVC